MTDTKSLMMHYFPYHIVHEPKFPTLLATCCSISKLSRAAVGSSRPSPIGASHLWALPTAPYIAKLDHIETVEYFSNILNGRLTLENTVAITKGENMNTDEVHIWQRIHDESQKRICGSLFCLPQLKSYDLFLRFIFPNP